MELNMTACSVDSGVYPDFCVSYPFKIWAIELTNKCPFKCIMCPRTNHMTRPQGFMDFELFKKIIDQLVTENPVAIKQYDLLLHHFGESLLHPQFERFMSYAVQQGTRATLSVNPLMLKTNTSRRLLEAKPHKIHVSLDGHDNKSFEYIRGIPNAYDKSHQNLLQFIEMKNKISPSTIVVVAMIGFMSNVDSIMAVKQFWETLEGVDDFMIKDFITWDGSAEDVNRLRWSPPAPTQTSKVTCPFPQSCMCVAWDGDVVPCCYDYNKKYVLGNAGTSSLKNIWNGEPMRRLRHEFNSNVVTNPLCRQCEALRCGASISS